MHCTNNIHCKHYTTMHQTLTQLYTTSPTTRLPSSLMCHSDEIHCDKTHQQHALHTLYYTNNICNMHNTAAVLVDTAYCIWSVLSSQSLMSISLVSFQRNVAKET